MILALQPLLLFATSTPAKLLGNIKMMDQLFLLDKDGPDTLLVNSVGQTVLHVATYAACNPDPSVKPDLTVLEHLFRHFTAARKRVLLDSPDRAGRAAKQAQARRLTAEERAKRPAAPDAAVNAKYGKAKRSRVQSRGGERSINFK